MLTTRAQRIYDSAKLAYDIGLVPILLRGKVPFMTQWQLTPHRESLDKFYGYLLSKGPNEQNQVNVGVLTGATDAPLQVVVVDLDVKGNGVERWNQLIQNSPVPNTLIVRTGSGGYHIYFLYTPKISGLLSFTMPTLGIDYRSTGGQVVWPYSLHPTSGTEYQFFAGYTVNGNYWQPTFAEMPDWLVQYLIQIRPGK